MSIRLFTAGATALALLASAMPASAAHDPDGYEKAPGEQVEADASKGVAQAQFELGRRFYYEEGMKSDALALQWFLKAAEQGVREAQYEAATMYILGEATPVDPEKAMYWYRRAAALGYVAANYDIAGMYYNGEGVAIDYAEAAKWFRIAADLGEVRSQYNLGLMYRDGKGVTPDSAQAVSWLKAAVKQKYLPAAEALEIMYRDGQGVDKDPVVAHAWRTMASYLRNAEAASQVPDGGKAVYAILSTPKLSLDDNIKAWDIYAALMVEMGFVAGDTPGPDGRTARDSARDFFRNPPADAGDSP